MKHFIYFVFASIIINSALAQTQPTWKGKFEQLGSETIPTPNSYRTGSGAPGPNYWQQRADYIIDVEVNDETHLLTGKETITYYNNSPEALRYLSLQLDQNILAENNMTSKTQTDIVEDSIDTKTFGVIANISSTDYKGGHTIKSIKDITGKRLPYIINNTMMRVDLPTPMKTGDKFIFSIEWSYTEYDRSEYDQCRGGYEFFS